MKIRVIIFLIFSMTGVAFAQNKKLTADSDTVFWMSNDRKIRNQIGLESIDKIDSKFFFRLWDGLSIIEINSVNEKFTGVVTHVVQQYKHNKAGRVYFRKTALSEATTMRIYDLVLRFGIIQLPTDKQIIGWESGFDGITYIIEHADGDTYSFKNYWTPSNFENKLTEAKQLTDFLDHLNKIDELNLIGKEFMRRQPFSSWYNFIGSATVVSKVY